MIKKTDNRKNAVQGVEKFGHLYSAGGNINSASTLGNSLTVSQKVNTDLPYDPAIPPRYILKRN